MTENCRLVEDAMRCATCRFWSEMIAEATGSSPLKALCLSPVSPHAHQMTSEKMGCHCWQENWAGSVDAPPDNGETARKLYEREGSAF